MPLRASPCGPNKLASRADAPRCVSGAVRAARRLVEAAARLVVFKSGSAPYGKRGSLLKNRDGRLDKSSEQCAQLARAPRGLSARKRPRRGLRSGHPDGKVVGVENAQMGWFNAKLGARRTRHREGSTPLPLPLPRSSRRSHPRRPSFPSGPRGAPARRNNVTTSEIR